MPSTIRKTRYAADRDGMVCLLLDVRGQARAQSLQVYSYSKGAVVNLPRSQIKIETENAKRWAAVSVPRWLAQREGLYGKPELPAIPTGFSLTKLGDTRTIDQKRDDAERELAQYVVDQQNRYRCLPGQRLHSPKGDRRNASIFA
jgi:hypothetical protein